MVCQPESVVSPPSQTSAGIDVSMRLDADVTDFRHSACVFGRMTGFKVGGEGVFGVLAGR